MNKAQLEKFFPPEFNPTAAVMTQAERQAMEATVIKYYREQPFFTYIIMDRLDVVWTKDIPTAATDGVANIYFNPTFMAGLTMPQRQSAITHEVLHVIYEHLPRDKVHEEQLAIQGVKYDHQTANIAQDYRVNHDIKASGGELGPGWYYDPAISEDHTYEVIYKKIYRPPPPPQQNQQGAPQQGQGGSGRPDPSQGRPDPGGFDVHLPPPVDRTTGKPVKPDSQGMKQTVLQAAAHAKAMGKMPAGLLGFVGELEAPQVPWEEHIKQVLVTLLGTDEVSYKRPHRRRMAVSFEGYQSIWPGKTGHSTGVVVMAGDTSGSMGDREKTAACSEIAGVLEEVKPKEMYVAWCDAEVGRVDEVHNVEDLQEALTKGIPGGGGTDFRPVFDMVEERGIQPDCLVFITDGYGRFPKEAPPYPVIWCMTTDKKAPFGDVVRIRVPQ